MCRMYNNNSICLHIVTRCIACHVKYSFIVSIVTHVLTLLPLLFFRKASAGLAQQRNKPGARLNARCSSMLRNKNWSVDLWNPFKPRPNPLTSKTIYRNDFLILLGLEYDRNEVTIRNLYQKPKTFTVHWTYHVLSYR